MFVLANPDGSIQYIGSVNTPGAVEVDDALQPVDLPNTFALGKYTFVNGAFVETPGWVMPPPPVLPDHMQPPV